jgi:hypothetical protein
MSGSSDDPAEPPRRRRRASRRAAGPPASVSTPAAAELNDDAAGLEPAGSSAGSDGAEHSVAERSPRHAAVDPSAIDVAATNPTAPDPTIGAEDTTMEVGGSAATGPAMVDAVHSHGSPAGAPGHQPGHVHGHPAAQGHQPGQGQSSATQGKDRSTERYQSGESTGGEPSRRGGRSSREEASERSLRSLVTTRSTQVSTTAALRAREVALPSAAELAAAEADLVIVRRHYVPPTTLTSGRRQDWPNRRGSGGQGGARPAGG